MNDMLSGGPALPGRSALEQMGDTNGPVEISDGEAKTVRATIMASAMAADWAAEGDAGDAKVSMLPAPYHTPRPRSVTSLLPITIIHSATLTVPTFWCGRPPR